jgi:hypothetical protein
MRAIDGGSALVVLESEPESTDANVSSVVALEDEDDELVVPSSDEAVVVAEVVDGSRSSCGVAQAVHARIVIAMRTTRG